MTEQTTSIELLQASSVDIVNELLRRGVEIHEETSRAVLRGIMTEVKPRDLSAGELVAMISVLKPAWDRVREPMGAPGAAKLMEAADEVDGWAAR
jgi:hypothetical protein